MRLRLPIVPTLRSRRGFALLLTLTLLAFVVLLLVGLATYTRVETAVAGNMQRQAQARENALLALNVALDQLQKYAGPDRRVTATAEAVSGVNTQKRFYTGVWDSAEDATTGGTPLVWLASGAEKSAGVDVTTAVTANRSVTLVGSRTDSSATANNTVAELQDITAPGVPGVAGNATIGRYAWWVGDQGVKAPVAVAATTEAIDYAPFVDGPSTDLRARIAQQIGLGAGAANSVGDPAFEVRDANNAPLVTGDRIATTNQLAFLRDAGNTTLGLASARQNYHAWSPNNFAVIADTRRGGLKQDLSLKPDLLGSAFVAWANYPAYMEPTDGSSTLTPAIVPSYGTGPLRRRYTLTPHLFGAGGSHQVGPVLTDFCLAFNVRTVGESRAANAPVEIRAVWMLSLWNPYTSSLVPEDLRVEITGLPTSVEVRDATDMPVGPSIPLARLFTGDGRLPLRVSLPWPSAEMPSDVDAVDRISWLPGRVYTWRSIEDTTKGTIPSDGYASRFYTRSFTATGETNDGVQRAVTGVTVDGDADYKLAVSGASQLSITVYAMRADGPVRIGRFTSPAFQTGFGTTAQKMSQSTFQFAYIFRLQDSVDTPANPGAWLTTAQIDVRRRSLQSEAFHLDNGDDPAVYANPLQSLTTAKHDRLLFRSGGSRTYNEDVPVFELPRAPLLSLGQLQHFRIVGSRPFMIGNPWGAGATLNGYALGSLFDRFYFSGVAEGVTPGTPAGRLALANPLLKPLRKADGSQVTLDEFRATATATVETPTDPAAPVDEDTDETAPTTTAPAPSVGDGRSSKFLLQAGAFNLNSTNAAAWAAALRNVRFVAPESFAYLDASDTSGTAADHQQATSEAAAAFFRFPQSAQETFKAEPGLSAPGEEVTPPNTHLFRRGMRVLSGAQVSALAAKIAELVKAKHGAADEALRGPFRSLEEFLAPSALFAGVDTEGAALAPRSLLEAAIADAGINADIAEFSSQWLTQADIMTALAPVLFPRSDTFVIRTHGQALNPATGALEGRAWCEAVVQRVPDYVDATDAPEVLPADLQSDLNKRYGRRFKIVSFRWLTLSDI